MKDEADKARKTSDSIVENFETIDKDLQKSTVTIDSANNILYDSLVRKFNK